MNHETLTYQADGLTMRSQLFFEPASGPRAGVLVFPEAFGLGQHAISRAERLAALGYVALACDLHGDGRVVDDLQEAIGLLQPMFADAAHTRARAAGGLQALTARPEVDAARVASIGFCFGGTMSLELARSGADLKAVVGFHSGLSTPAPATDAKAIKARVLVCIGADDPMIPPDQRTAFEAEMRDAGVDWQMHLYGNTVHSFTNPEAARRNHARRDTLQPGSRHPVLGLAAGTLCRNPAVGQPCSRPLVCRVRSSSTSVDGVLTGRHAENKGNSGADRRFVTMTNFWFGTLDRFQADWKQSVRSISLFDRMIHTHRGNSASCGRRTFCSA